MEVFPIIELGAGRIEVAEGRHDNRLALIFGRNGTGMIGEPTQSDRVHLPGETLAVVTFANVESLDVVLAKMHTLRKKLNAPNRLCLEGDCHYYGQKRPSTCCCSKEA